MDFLCLYYAARQASRPELKNGHEVTDVNIANEFCFQMHIIGILSTTSALKMAKLSGTRDAPQLEKLPDTLKFPDGESEGHVLHTLGKQVIAVLHEHKPDEVRLLKVVGSQHNHPLEIRVKIEGLLQMLGARLEIPTVLVPPVTLRNQEKKFDIFTGKSPEECLNKGQKFKSVDLRTAVLTAWVGLPG